MARTLTEDLDNLYTTTWQNMKGDVADQIFDAVPFWFWMKDNGQLDGVEGGRFLEEPLRYAKSDNVRFIGKGSTMPLSDKEFLTAAIYEWRYLADSVVRFGTDDQQNRGKASIMSLMNAKLANSKDSLVDRIEEVLFGAGTRGANDTHDPFNGLQTLVADDPTSGTVGQVNSATYDWWRNQETDYQVDESGTDFATDCNTVMTKMLNNCGNNLRQDRPDIIVSGQTPYEQYEDFNGQFKRTVNSSLADAGFEHQVFKGIPMIWSPQCANTRMYLLNTRFLRFKYDTSLFFDMTRWKDIPDQVNDRVAQIILAGNLLTGRRRVHGVIHNIQ